MDRSIYGSVGTGLAMEHSVGICQEIAQAILSQDPINAGGKPALWQPETVGVLAKMVPVGCHAHGNLCFYCLGVQIK